MIRTIFGISWLNLKRDVVALALTFILPLIFFTILATIFAGSGGSSDQGPKAIKLLVVDLDQSDLSRRLVAALETQDALAVTTGPEAETQQPAPYSLADARRRVREGAFPVAVVLPAGFGSTLGSMTLGGESIELIYDAADPIARHSVSGLLQAAAITAAPNLMMQQGLAMLGVSGGSQTEEQRRAFDQVSGFLAAGGTSGFASTLVQVDEVDVRNFDTEEAQPEKRRRSIVPYQAAGIGVMFLLFSMAGAGGALLEEEESGVLERLMSSNASMTHVLLGKWLFFAATGAVQVVLMFLWGESLFGLGLWTQNRVAGLLVMTLATAAAAAGFGILLAAACRSRAQLSGMSTILILTMSALGGSMVPRFVMPDFMNTTALFTINGWALDGFLKVFWYDDPKATLGQALSSLLPELLVLLAMAVTFLLLARFLARRWETV